MKRTTIFCLLSAAAGGLVATSYHQTAQHWTVAAQEPTLRPPLIRSVETPPPATAPRRSLLPAAERLAAGSAFGSGLDEFVPEERTNILVYDKTNRSVVHITTKS